MDNASQRARVPHEEARSLEKRENGIKSDRKCMAVPIAVAVRLKTWVCSRSIFGIAVSNPAEVMDVLLLCVV
jgi:hypothetical protein